MPRFVPPVKRVLISPFPFNKAVGLSNIYYRLMARSLPRGFPLRLAFAVQRRSKFTQRPKHVA